MTLILTNSGVHSILLIETLRVNNTVSMFLFEFSGLEKKEHEYSCPEYFFGKQAIWLLTSFRQFGTDFF